MPDERKLPWDAFVSHAAEDQESFVRPLVAELEKYGLNIWFAPFCLRVGDSLRASIDLGLRQSRFGIVVLSESFFADQWRQRELNALFSLEIQSGKAILPVRHGIDQETVLGYSPMLADIIASDSSEGYVVVARSIVKVIRPEAFFIEVSRADTTKAAARLREQLREKSAHLDYRISYGPQELDPIKSIRRSSESGLVASGMTDGLKIDIFAIDKEAYDSNPLTFKARMPLETFKKLDELLSAGKVAEFGPEDGIKISPDFAHFFGLSSRDFAGIVQKLIVAPAAELMQRKFRFQLTFQCGEESKIFPYVEFEMIRPGREEIEIRSHSLSLPFQLILILNASARGGRLSMNFSYAGHEIRSIYKAHRAFKLLLAGGTLEIVDLESEQKFATLGTMKTTEDSASEVYIDRFIEALYEVAVAFGEDVTWGSQRSQEDSIHLQWLQEIVRTGQLSLPVREIQFQASPAVGVDLKSMLGQKGVLRIEQMAGAPEFATVFGKTFDVGPHILLANPLAVEFISVDNSADIIIRMILAEPLVYAFEKFRPK